MVDEYPLENIKLMLDKIQEKANAFQKVALETEPPIEDYLEEDSSKELSISKENRKSALAISLFSKAYCILQSSNLERYDKNLREKITIDVAEFSTDLNYVFNAGQPNKEILININKKISKLYQEIDNKGGLPTEAQRSFIQVITDYDKSKLFLDKQEKASELADASWPERKKIHEALDTRIAGSNFDKLISKIRKWAKEFRIKIGLDKLDNNAKNAIAINVAKLQEQEKLQAPRQNPRKVSKKSAGSPGKV